MATATAMEFKYSIHLWEKIMGQVISKLPVNSTIFISREYSIEIGAIGP